MVTHDEVHLEAQDRYWREHPEERPKPQGYLWKVSEALREIERAIKEINRQRLAGENFSREFRNSLHTVEMMLRNSVKDAQASVEVEAKRQESRNGR